MAWLPQSIPSKATGVAGFWKNHLTRDVLRTEASAAVVGERRRNLGTSEDHNEGWAIRGSEEERRCVDVVARAVVIPKLIARSLDILGDMA